ncbi:MAG: MarR family transcriptional regulator [Nitrospinae bacterium]|nr:MarR family transcriptional regulator [Nitrospinota bacterium]
MAKEFKQTWKAATGGKKVPSAVETICFDSTEEMQKFLSPERIRLIRTIHDLKPKSIIELATQLERDRKNVTEDVKMLESVGLIERKRRIKGGKSKEKVRLSVDYDRIQLDIAV